MKFFILQHIRYYEDNSFSDQKFIGIYSSKNLVEKKKQEYLKKEGFMNHPNGFIITETYLDDINCIEGFIELNK